MADGRALSNAIRTAMITKAMTDVFFKLHGHEPNSRPAILLSPHHLEVARCHVISMDAPLRSRTCAVAPGRAHDNLVHVTPNMWDREKVPKGFLRTALEGSL